MPINRAKHEYIRYYLYILYPTSCNGNTPVTYANHFWSFIVIMVSHVHKTIAYSFMQPLLNLLWFIPTTSHYAWLHATTAKLIVVYANHFWSLILIAVCHDPKVITYGCMQLLLNLFWSTPTTSKPSLWLSYFTTIRSSYMLALNHCWTCSGMCQPFLIAVCHDMIGSLHMVGCNHC